MSVTFDPQALIIEKLVARAALTQLNNISVFARAALGDYEEGSFQVGDTVKFRRARISNAVDYDPRTGVGLNLEQPGYVTGELKLERLLANGFPIYSSDYQIDTYVRDFGEQLAFSIATEFDRYLYGKFRTPVHAAAGVVEYSANPPLAIVASETNSGELADFNRYVLVNSNTVLERENVPPGQRYAILSTTAKGSYIGEAVPVDAGYLEAIAGGAQLLQNGLPTGQFVPRHGFMVGGSNLTSSQMGDLSLDASVGNATAIAIAAVEADLHNGGSAFFLKGDYQQQTVLGAVRLTVTTTGALQNIAVGDIARLGPDNGIARAYGVVLRVDLANKYVWLVPYSPKGRLLTAAEVNTTTDKLSIPTIPSISVAYHQEALAFSTRQMRAPSMGSGAVAATQMDPGTRIAMQVWRGSYDVTKFREAQAATLLCGAKLTHAQKAVLMISL